MHSFRRILITRNSLAMLTRSQSKQTSSYVLTHNQAAQEFHMEINSNVATVGYSKNDEVLDLVESYVPESLRGQGVGHILAKSTFDYIDQNNLKMKVTCVFLRKVYEENKNKYSHLISE